jgi:hypothetical protein
MGIFCYVAAGCTVMFLYDVVVRDMRNDESCVRIAYSKIMVLFWLSMLFKIMA